MTYPYVHNTGEGVFVLMQRTHENPLGETETRYFFAPAEAGAINATPCPTLPDGYVIGVHGITGQPFLGTR